MISRIILETPRLILREFVTHDAEDLARVICDPETMRYYPMRFTREQADEWIARNLERYAADGHGLWAVVLKESGEFIGDCGVIRQHLEGGDELEIGYHLHRAQWGRGYATEAARACRDWIFANTAAPRAISLIRPENLPSRRVAERNGMTIWKEIEWRGLPHYVYVVERFVVTHATKELR
jgi:RimJ/RimL family protein N-acetyltransferase